MTVYVLMIVQSIPLRNETIHSIYSSMEAAEDAATEMEYKLPANFEIAIEPFDVLEEDDYED